MALAAGFGAAFNQAFDQAFDGAFNAQFDAQFQNTIQQNNVAALTGPQARVVAHNTRDNARDAARQAGQAAAMQYVVGAVEAQVADLNTYATLKTATKGLMDVALLVNVYDFRKSDDNKDDPPYFVALTSLLITSIVLQFIVLLILAILGSMTIRENKFDNSADTTRYIMGPSKQ
jgi:Ninjurin